MGLAVTATTEPVVKVALQLPAQFVILDGVVLIVPPPPPALVTVSVVCGSTTSSIHASACSWKKKDLGIDCQEMV